jgi:hypothetical protein
MLRRFETYSLRSLADSDTVAEFERALETAPEFIPEVLDSKIGRDLSDEPIQLVWEHAFASPEAYRRYMEHPYHANVLDRFLLFDSPERVVTDRGLDAGLFGYHCSQPTWQLDRGVRRLLLFRVDQSATPLQMAQLERAFVDELGLVPGMTLCVVAANTLGGAWFDGTTPIGRPPTWTHLCEQGFSNLDALSSYLDPSSREKGLAEEDSIIEAALSFHYQVGLTQLVS